MRVRTTWQSTPAMHTKPVSHRPRRGVILIVVLALLTLFQIGAISFVLYADTGKVGVTQCRDPARILRDETGVYSAMVGNDLMRSLDEDVDFRSALESTDHLAVRARDLRIDARLALELVRDPEKRQNLTAFLARIEQYEDSLAALRWILIRIQFGPADRR